MAVLFDYTSSNPSVPSSGADRPVITDWITVDVDTDATGEILMYKFPDVAYLPNRAGQVLLFVEDAPGGSFAAGIDITDSDGVQDYALAGAAARSQNDTVASAAIAAPGGAYVDVGGKYITLDITVVGTNTACTMQLAVEFTQNVIKKTVSA